MPSFGIELTLLRWQRLTPKYVYFKYSGKAFRQKTVSLTKTPTSTVKYSTASIKHHTSLNTMTRFSA